MHSFFYSLLVGIGCFKVFTRVKTVYLTSYMTDAINQIAYFQCSIYLHKHSKLWMFQIDHHLAPLYSYSSVFSVSLQGSPPLLWLSCRSLWEYPNTHNPQPASPAASLLHVTYTNAHISGSLIQTETERHTEHDSERSSNIEVVSFYV